MKNAFERASTPDLCHLLALAMAQKAHLTAKAILNILATRLSEARFGI